MEVIRYDHIDEVRKAFLAGCSLSADLIGIITSFIRGPPTLEITVRRKRTSKQCAICLQADGFNENVASMDIPVKYSKQTGLIFNTCDMCRSLPDPSKVFDIPIKYMRGSKQMVMFIMPLPIINTEQSMENTNKYRIFPYVQVPLIKEPDLYLNTTLLLSEIFVLGPDDFFKGFETVVNVMQLLDDDNLFKQIRYHIERLMALNRWPVSEN